MLDKVVTKILDRIANTKSKANLWAGFFIGFLIFKIFNVGGNYFNINSYDKGSIYAIIFKIILSNIVLFLIAILIIRGKKFEK